MPYHIDPTQDFGNTPTFNKLIRPLNDILHGIPELESRGHRPLQMDFEHQLKALIFYHLEEHSSGRHLLQVLEEDDGRIQQMGEAYFILIFEPGLR